MTNTEIIEKIHEFLIEEFEVEAEKLVPETHFIIREKSKSGSPGRKNTDNYHFRL